MYFWLNALKFSRRQASWGSLFSTPELEAPKLVIIFKMWFILENNCRLSGTGCSSHMHKEAGASGPAWLMDCFNKHINLPANEGMLL